MSSFLLVLKISSKIGLNNVGPESSELLFDHPHSFRTGETKCQFCFSTCAHNLICNAIINLQKYQIRKSVRKPLNACVVRQPSACSYRLKSVAISQGRSWRITRRSTTCNLKSLWKERDSLAGGVKSLGCFCRDDQMEIDVSNIVLASIGWTLVLTVAVMAAVFAVNAQFSSLENKFDRKIEALENKIDGLQNLILQQIIPHPDNQDSQ